MKTLKALAAWGRRILDLWPTNQDKPGTKLAIFLFIVVLVIAFLMGREATAEEKSIQVGGGVTYIRGTAPVVDLALVYPDLGPFDSVVEIGATFIGESKFRDELQRNNFAWRVSLVEHIGRFEIGLGFAYLQNVDAYNGSHTNFNLLLGYRFKRWPITLRPAFHFSNGGTVSPNRGRDIGLFIVRIEK